MSEGIDHPAKTPAVLLDDGIDLPRTGGQCAGKEGIGIGDSEDDADRATAERLRAEIEIFRRLATDPEFGALDGETCDDIVAGVEAKNFSGSQGRFVELDGAGAVADGEPRGDGRGESGKVGHGFSMTLRRALGKPATSTLENRLSRELGRPFPGAPGFGFAGTAEAVVAR